MRKTIVISLLSLASFLVQAQEKIYFSPQWTAQAQFAGYYVAKEKGFYMKAGLDVEIEHPSVTQTAISRIRSNEIQVTTLPLAQAMEIIDDGIPLVNILQTSMNNAMVIVSRWGKYPIRQVGEKVGIWNAGFGQIAICMSLRDKLDYHWVPFANNVNLFLSGAIDATLAMSYNEYYQLLQAGIELDKNSVYRFCDHGYNIQDDGVYMTLDYYNGHKEIAQQFAEASRRGWEWAAENPDEALDIVMDYIQKEHISTNRVLQKLMLEEILKLQIDRESGEREFRLRPDMVEQASELMLESGMLEHAVNYEDIAPE